MQEEEEDQEDEEKEKEVCWELCLHAHAPKEAYSSVKRGLC